MMGRRRNQHQPISKSSSSRSSSSSSSSSSSRISIILIVLGCLICLAFGLNVYLSIVHDPTKTKYKNSNGEPIIQALLLLKNNITINNPIVEKSTSSSLSSSSSDKNNSNANNNNNNNNEIIYKDHDIITTIPIIDINYNNNKQRSNNNNSTTKSISKPTSKPKTKIIQILLPVQEIEWIKKRSNVFNESINFDKLRSFYSKAQNDPLSRSGDPNHNYAIDSSNNGISDSSGGDSENNIAVKVNGKPGISLGDGPWLDFMVAGNPKCGTTTLIANLQRIAPIRAIDFCVGVTQTLRNSYIEWPSNPKYTKEVITNMGGNSTHNNWLRGSKCPRFLNQNFLLGFSALLPKTKLIIGIRHPIDWYTSFWNMNGGNAQNPKSNMENIQICPCPVDPQTGIRPKKCPLIKGNENELCWGECRCGSTLCLHRSRLHLPLARLGKTSLSKEERQWLAPDDDDGGINLFNANITNPIFLYDLKQMKNDDYWNDLASFLGVSHIPNEEYRGSHGLRDRDKQQQRDLCGNDHDYFRSLIMKYSYELSMWLQIYFIPQTTTAASNSNRNSDVTIAGGGGGGNSNNNVTNFVNIVESYKYDPCQRLIRRDSDGIYVLKEQLRSSVNIDSEEGGDENVISIGMDTTIPKQCEAKK